MCEVTTRAAAARRATPPPHAGDPQHDPHPPSALIASLGALECDRLNFNYAAGQR